MNNTNKNEIASCTSTAFMSGLGAKKHRNVLYINVDTYNEESLSEVGIQRYAERAEIILIGIALNDQPPKVYETTDRPAFIPELEKLLCDPEVLKCAYCAEFEMTCLGKAGYTIVPEQWMDVQLLAKYAGLPPSLAELSQVLNLGRLGKPMWTPYADMFCRPDARRGVPYRNWPQDFPEQWAGFVEGNRQDLVAERVVHKRLACFDQPNERPVWLLDLQVNRRGIRVDKRFLTNAAVLSGEATARYCDCKKQWGLFKRAEQALDADGRLHNIFNYYGEHTGCWTERKVRLEDLPENYLCEAEDVRQLVKDRHLNTLMTRYGKIGLPKVFEQLAATMFVPDKGQKFVCVSFPKLELTIASWLTDAPGGQKLFDTDQELFTWLRDVATPKSLVRTKDCELVRKAESILMYGGAAGELEKLGLNYFEASNIVKRWRRRTVPVVSLWHRLGTAVIQAVEDKTLTKITDGKVTVLYENDCLAIRLPSGRTVYYQSPAVEHMTVNPKVTFFEQRTIPWIYWCKLYNKCTRKGSGFMQDLVQAIARDYLAAVMLRLESRNYPVVAHTPSEIVLEVPLETAVKDIQRVVDLPVEWAPELITTNKIRIHEKFYIKGED